MNNDILVNLIADFVHSTPVEMVGEVSDSLQAWQGMPSTFLKAKIISSIHNPQTKYKLSNLMDCWISTCPELSAASISLSLRASLISLQTSVFPAVEIIWTGPEETGHNFRRTDQALLELITESKENLLIVSFAVYKAESIIQAIENAILRNVKVVVCLEDAEDHHGKLSVSGINAFSSSIFKIATFYNWPIENRPRSMYGKYGSLHAKIAVADQKKVFVSSANLTDYAMDLNMEMGVIIEDREIGEKITGLFNQMILNSVLKEISFPN